MSTLGQNISTKLRSGNILYWLIGINVAVFLVKLLAPVTDAYLLLPAFLTLLKPHFWAPLTYMFESDNFFGIIFNMLWLYWLGGLIEEYLGNKRLLGLYILGALAGAAAFIIGCGVIPYFMQSTFFLTYFISGASVSIMCLMAAAATLLPQHTVVLFIWPVKLKWLVLGYILLNLITIRNSGGGTVIAILGGALFGFVYIKRLQKGSDWITSIGNAFKRGPRLSKLRVVARNTNKRSSGRPRQDEVDRILDKISTTGYENLTKEEKETLFRASKNES